MSLNLRDEMKNLELVVFTQAGEEQVKIMAPYPTMVVSDPDATFLGYWLSSTLGRGWRVISIEATHVRPGKRGEIFRVVSEQGNSPPNHVTYWEVMGKDEKAQLALADFVKQKREEYVENKRHKDAWEMDQKNQADQKELEKMSRYTRSEVTRNEAGGYDFD